MTVAEELRAEGRKQGEKKGRVEGRAEGRVEGRAEGRREALLHVLSRRFGTVPKATRARVMAAKGSEVDGWLDRAIDAPTLNDVFRASH